MAFLELVKKRASVRKYTAAPISRETIDRCLEAARLAPSACNSQPWNFIVVDDPVLRERVSKAAFSGPYSMNAVIGDAPVLVVVTRARSRVAAKLGGFFRDIQYNLIDIGISCEHFILQATEEGIGTCWLGWFNGKAVKKVLKIPRNLKADIIISMGYPEQGSWREKVRKPLKDMVRYNNG